MKNEPMKHQLARPAGDGWVIPSENSHFPEVAMRQAIQRRLDTRRHHYLGPGTLVAKWQESDGSDQNCTMDYALQGHTKSDKKSTQDVYEQITAICKKPKA